ncbi:uncharacterized protein LOC134544681 [Bacillus rossius redtenbacheri]|uniref:uncharacterized protein LOC134544681 n=1 Tax=Bacillus rossius redtenbacheri TaxID=93214 RepID=UPI002FDD393B
MAAPVEEHSGAQLRGNLRAVVEGVARRERFTDIEVEVGRASSKGDNYIGELLRVRLKGRRDGEEGQGMSLVVKLIPDSEAKREALDMDSFFDNELFVYSEVMPAFQSLQEDRRVPEAERFGAVPKLLACDRSEGGVSLVLEDMSPRGYRMADRLKGLDSAHCSLVMKELGRFHAFSFALRDQRPEELQRLRSGVTETLFGPRAHFSSEQGKASLKQNIDQASSTMLKRFPLESEYMERFRRFCSDFNKRGEAVASGEAAEPCAVICHGDCWTNNILFKYSEGDETPEALCLLDLQLSRYSSPVTDIAYFLYCCTEGTVRREAYKSLLSDYYNSFSQFLRKLGSDPEKMFPYSAFKEHLSKFSQFGLAMALVAMPLFTAASEDTLGVEHFGKETADEAFSKVACNERYLRRMGDVIEDMVDWNLI